MRFQRRTMLLSSSTFGILAIVVESTLALTSKEAPKATVSVCTGADCRVDGASPCLRALQQHPVIQNSRNAGSNIAVKARPCLGPCGDGPNVVILDSEDNKVVRERAFQPPTSLVPPSWFGETNQGVYQVRSVADVDFCVQLAAETAGVELAEDDPRSVNISSSRPWYDRPRNERKVLQRVMHFLILVGLYTYMVEHDGVIGVWQWQIAGALAVASNFIMKENLLEQLWDRLYK